MFPLNWSGETSGDLWENFIQKNTRLLMSKKIIMPSQNNIWIFFGILWFPCIEASIEFRHPSPTGPTTHWQSPVNCHDGMEYGHRPTRPISSPPSISDFQFARFSSWWRAACLPGCPFNVESVIICFISAPPSPRTVVVLPTSSSRFVSPRTRSEKHSFNVTTKIKRLFFFNNTYVYIKTAYSTN